MSVLCQLRGAEDAPTLTLTEDYLIINGPHRQIVNGYTYNKKSSVSIKTKDVLSIERKYTRSKRNLVLCICFFCLIPFLIYLISFASQAGKTVSRAINTIENIQYWTNGLINNDHEAINDLISVVGTSGFNGIIESGEDSGDFFSAVSDIVGKVAATTQSDNSSISGIAVFIIIICVLSFAGAGFFLVMYLKPTAVILIHSLGYNAAVPCGKYPKGELMQFVARCVEIAL